MKKIFAFATAIIFALSLNATVVTLLPSDFSAATNAATSASKDGVSAAITSGTITSDQIRIFKNQTITISSDKEISAIVFTCTAGGTDQYGPGCFEAQDGYSYKNTVGTWIGTSASVSFKASSNQVRAKKIEVYLDGETPAEDTWVADTISVSKALELIDAADAHDHFVVGVVACQPFDLFSDFSGKVSFWMSDVDTPADTLEAYQVLGKDKAQWESLKAAWEELRIGDTILVYAASLAKYQTTYEIASGFYVEKLGANPNPPEIVDPTEEIPELPEGVISCDSALVLAAALEDPTADNKTVKGGTVVVRGYVSYAYGASDGKQSAWLNDKKSASAGQVQGSYLQLVGDAVVKGDYVELNGTLAKYFKAGKDGKADEIIIEVIDGTIGKVGAQGIENIVLTEKVQKVVVDGAVYVVRDGKMFNILGTQVR